MKVCVLADTHFGVRQDSEAFHDNMEKFYSEIFFPEVKSRNISHIIHVGDVFDNRKKIDMYTARRAREYFFETLKESAITMDVTAGNHDLYFRHESNTTALREILGLYKNIRFFTDVTDVSLAGGKPICYVPWIHNNNRDESIERIKNSKSEIVFGHLELTGYQMYKGQISKHGEDPALFERFQHAYSGHFHHKNSRANITYLGSTSQHIWSDHGDVRGFHIFDTETYDVEFVANPYHMFEILNYDEDDSTLPDVKGKYVRLLHGEIKSQSKLDKFIKQLIESGVADLKVIPSASYSVKYNANTNVRDDKSVNIEDALALMRSVVEEDDVYSKLEELYNKAQLCM